MKPVNCVKYSAINFPTLFAGTSKNCISAIQAKEGFLGFSLHITFISLKKLTPYVFYTP